MCSSDLSEAEVADLTAQREAALAQQSEAQYQVGVAQQDLASASDQLQNANNQYDAALASANAINNSPAQDPVNTQPAPVPILGQTNPNVVDAVTAALGQNVSQGVQQLIRTAQNVVSNVAAIPSVVAAQIGSIITQATGVSPNSDAYAAAVTELANRLLEQGVDPNIIDALARTAQGTVDQALLDQARQVATLRQQTQNPAQSGD